MNQLELINELEWMKIKHKKIVDFKKQTNHSIPAWRQDIVLTKKKQPCNSCQSNGVKTNTR